MNDLKFNEYDLNQFYKEIINDWVLINSYKNSKDKIYYNAGADISELVKFINGDSPLIKESIYSFDNVNKKGAITFKKILDEISSKTKIVYSDKITENSAPKHLLNFYFENKESFWESKPQYEVTDQKNYIFHLVCKDFTSRTLHSSNHYVLRNILFTLGLNKSPNDFNLRTGIEYDKLPDKSDSYLKKSIFIQPEYNQFLGPIDTLFLQSLHGENSYYNAENNTYTISNLVDHEKNSAIWDTDGIDTIQCNHFLGAFINLLPGGVSYSSTRRYYGTEFDLGYLFSIGYNVTIENLAFYGNSFSPTIFLNAANNKVDFVSEDNDFIIYFTDTYIDTSFNKKDKNKPIVQKLTRAINQDGQISGGWGHDRIAIKPQRETYGRHKRNIVIDVQNPFTLKFQSSIDNDLIITHEATDLYNPQKKYLSSITIENYKDCQSGFTFLIRTNAIRQWILLTRRLKKYVLKKEDLKDYQNSYDMNYNPDKKNFSTYPFDVVEGTPFERELTKRDKNIAYVAQNQSETNNQIDTYKVNKETFKYVPLVIKWNDVKDNQIDLAKIVKPVVRNQILSKAEAVLTTIPSDKEFYIGEVIYHKDFHKIDDNTKYDIIMQRHNDPKSRTPVRKKLIGHQIKSYKIARPLEENSIFTFQVSHDGKPIYSSVVQHNKNTSRIHFDLERAEFFKIKGKRIALGNFSGIHTSQVNDLSRYDGLSFKNNNRALRPGVDYKTEKLDDFTSHWKGEGMGVFKTTNRNSNDYTINVALFGSGS